MTKRCLICENAIEADTLTVYNATVWTCQGNYGSAIYDPVSGGVFLEAVICDACLVRRKDSIEEVTVTRPPDVIERSPPSF